MSGFDLAELLPFYLDETDEQIVGLGDMLLKLEQDPADEKALREAFRLIHSIKGASTVMGFTQVKGLTHHLETYFDELRAGKRTLDRTSLDLCFRCLDALRDFHRDLRAHGENPADLSGLTARVIAHLENLAEGTSEPSEPAPSEVEALTEVPPSTSSPLVSPEAELPSPSLLEQRGVVCLTLVFEPNLPWPDMKARLVLNRLTAKGRILATEPPVERLDDATALPQFAIWIAAECDLDELHSLADVDGVSEIRVETGAMPVPQPVPDPIPIPDVPAFAPVATTQPAGPSSSSEAPAIGPTPTAGEAATTARKPRVTETVRVDVDRLDHLMNLAGELVISKARFFEIARGLDELFRGSNAQLLASDTADRLESIARGLEDLPDVASYVNGSAERWLTQIRRLRENFREIQEELDIIRVARERLGAMGEAIHHLARVSDGIQRGVLETRMVPIGPLFDRFHRVIRDLRHQSNKEVVLRTDGEKTELDKRMIDELGDPLIHLVRNSVDHGLESPRDRELAGKSRAGTVSLTASHRGNSVFITVSDDGRGIDCERVRRKAVANGLLDDEVSRSMPDYQIIQFIWHPGLSTAETITDISGRGVGMDIVKSRIENLNGTVDVRSEPGQGTTFTIRLPLTLAILPVLLTRIEGETYAIPLDHLDEVVEVSSDQVYRVQGKPTIELRKRIISLLTLSDLFRKGRDGGSVPSGEESQYHVRKHTVALISNGEATAGLVVDELIGMQEAVLKSLERNFRPVHGLSGASILGDGRVALILDIDALINLATSESS